MKEKLKLAGAFVLGVIVAVGGSAITFAQTAKGRTPENLTLRVSRDTTSGLEVQSLLYKQCEYLIVDGPHGTAITPQLNGLGLPSCEPNAMDVLRQH